MSTSILRLFITGLLVVTLLTTLVRCDGGDDDNDNVKAEEFDLPEYDEEMMRGYMGGMPWMGDFGEDYPYHGHDHEAHDDSEL